MIKIEKKHWILAGLVLLLAVTGIVNFAVNSAVTEEPPIAVITPEPSEEPSQHTGAYAGLNYYTLFRKDRASTREIEIQILDEIINDENTDEETLQEAQHQKLALVDAMEKELLIEGLIKAKGFSECVVTMTGNSVNVVVENDKPLTSNQAVQIMEIVRRETGAAADDILIIPRN